MEMQEITITGKTLAIVCFGPATDLMGMRPGSFFQVTIDPNLVSPGGDYIRFDARPLEDREADEIHGWQKVNGLTVCEILKEIEQDPKGQSVTMMAVKE